LTSTNAHDNVVQGNWIGTDVSGLLDRGNTGPGVSIATASRNTVGGATATARNVISGNGQHGVQIAGSSTNQNVIAGNFIGTDATGAAKLANDRYGVYVTAANNRIGGSATGEGNVISGNGQGGIYLAGTGTTGNVIQGNRIGTNAAGTAALGNTSFGIDVRAPQTTIGGTAAGAGNLISGNGAAGIHVFGSTAIRNAIHQNSIFQNAALGIDLNGDGVTANDVGDPDAGPNQLQNFPVMTLAALSGGTLTINYSVPSVAPNSTFPLAVEFFLADADNQEGQRYLGGESYPAPGADSASFAVSGVSLGQWIVATATDADGNTSEFSVGVQIAAPLMAATEAEASESAGVTLMSLVQLEPLVDEAIQIWELAGLDAMRVAALRSLSIEVSDLPGRYLGLALPDRLILDADAAGWGWYTGLESPDAGLGNGDPSQDLLTAVLHEMGHVLGLDDVQDAGDLMAGVLQQGQRQIPTLEAIDTILAQGAW
jgi:hypothetical protein